MPTAINQFHVLLGLIVGIEIDSGIRILAQTVTPPTVHSLDAIHLIASPRHGRPGGPMPDESHTKLRWAAAERASRRVSSTKPGLAAVVDPVTISRRPPAMERNRPRRWLSARSCRVVCAAPV